MTGSFPAALGFVLRHECVYAPGHDDDLAFVVCEDVPGDSGGLTKYGIDAADHPGLDIRNLTLGQATAIYRDGEWTRCQCDDLPNGIDTAVFDCAVNNGIAVAGILLQRLLARNGFLIRIDGEIGRQTVTAARSEANLHAPDFLKLYLDLRRERYADIVLHHPADAKFLRGWLNRVNDLETFLSAPASIERAS